MIQVSKKLDRIEINLSAFEMGKDICIVLTGGQAHLGSVTVGSEGFKPETFVIGSHKEYVITKMLGGLLKKKYCGNFVICCGIHLDDITKEEISDIVNLSYKMVEEMCSNLMSKR